MENQENTQKLESSQDSQMDNNQTLEDKAPGQILMEKRESKGLRISDVSRELHLLPAYIMALESGEYGKIPASAFVKGYMRSYANYLELDANELIAKLPAEYQLERVYTQTAETQNNAKVQKMLFWLIGIFFLAGLIGLSFYWTQMGENQTEQTDAYAVKVEEQPSLDESNSEEVEARDVEQNNIVEQDVNAEQVEQNTTNQTNTKNNEEKIISAVAQKTEEIVEEKPKDLSNPNGLNLNYLSKLNGGTFVLTFVGDCWLEAKDADGNRVLEANAKVGDLIKINGKKPIRIVLGKARNSKANYKGKEFDLERYTGESVARFTIY